MLKYYRKYYVLEYEIINVCRHLILEKPSIKKKRQKVKKLNFFTNLYCFVTYYLLN